MRLWKQAIKWTNLQSEYCGKEPSDDCGHGWPWVSGQHPRKEMQRGCGTLLSEARFLTWLVQCSWNCFWSSWKWNKCSIPFHTPWLLRTFKQSQEDLHGSQCVWEFVWSWWCRDTSSFALKIVSCETHVSLFPVLPMNGGLQHRQEGQNEQKRICWIETFILLNTLGNFSLFQIGIEISKDKAYSPQTDPLLQLNSDLTSSILPGWKTGNLLLSLRLSGIKKNVRRANLKKSRLPFRWQVQKGTDTCWERCSRADRVPQFPLPAWRRSLVKCWRGGRKGIKAILGAIRDCGRDKGKSG